MIKRSISLKEAMPIDRRKAALIAQTASHYECTITLERECVVLNAKSMLGMLSQAMPKDGEMFLIADGEDEAAAVEAVCAVIEKL